ncbi:MAG TPA: hypothetical protein VE978_20845 [Chitinophagales bacterium]|nr:hypothetical protein [Chitinophagales bacterium]
MDQGDVRQRETERRSSEWIFILALVIVAGIAAYFFFRFYQGNEARAQLVKQAHIDSIHIASLDSMYTATRDSLTSYKGLNAQLDITIAEKENELSECRRNFLSTVRKNKLNEAAYKKQIADLQNLSSDFQNQVAQFQSEGKLLTTQRDSLGGLVQSQGNRIAQLLDSVAFLSKKVTIGSLLRPTSITVTGIHTKGSKDATTKKASKTDQLKVCFDLPVNDIAEPDTQTFYIRVLSPDGTLLSGSSTTTKNFNKAETGEEIPYSVNATVHYKNVAMNSCLYFRQPNTYTKGNYTIEIYQNGYLVGTQKFALK